MGRRRVANLPHHKIKQICSDWSLGRPNAVALLHFQNKVVNAVCVSIWGWDFIHALYPGMVIRRPPVARSRCPDGILESPVARSRCADRIIMSSYHGDGGQGQNCVGRVPSPPPRRGKPSGPGTCSGSLIHGKDGRDTRTRNASLAGSRGRPGTGSAGRRP